MKKTVSVTITATVELDSGPEPFSNATDSLMDSLTRDMQRALMHNVQIKIDSTTPGLPLVVKPWKPDDVIQDTPSVTTKGKPAWPLK